MKMNSLTALASLFLTAAPAFANEASEHPSTVPNDREIAQILLSVNRNEVDAGKLAKKRTSNGEVKAFADMMIREHTSVTEQTKQVAKKIKLRPEDSAKSDEIKNEGKRTEKKLKDLKGAEFDAEYVNEMVAGHQNLLSAIDVDLIPNVKSEELRALLTKVRPSVELHLQHAKALQSKLSSKGNAG